MYPMQNKTIEENHRMITKAQDAYPTSRNGLATKCMEGTIKSQHRNHRCPFKARVSINGLMLCDRHKFWYMGR